MKRILNGEPSVPSDEDHYYTGERVIKLPNITLELNRTPEGGWKDAGIFYAYTGLDPKLNLGSGVGGVAPGGLMRFVTHNPWVAEQFWRRIIELEDELRALRKAIHYKE